MKKKQIQVYTLKEPKKVGKIRKIAHAENFENIRVEEHAANYTSHHIDGASDEVYNFLQTNPFLYKGQYPISSIEEFYIDVKQKKVPFGAVIRSKDLIQAKKQKMIKKALKKWKSDFQNQKNSVFNKENDQLIVVGEVYSTRFSIINFLVLILLLLILTLINFKNGEMWTTFATRSFFSKLNAGIDLSFSHKWIKITSTLTIYQVFLTIFYGFFHNYIIRDFIRTNIGTNSVYKKSCNILEKDFRKKFKQTKKYYVKQKWKNPLQIAPFPIDKTAIGDVDLDKIKELIDAFIEKSASLKRKKTLLSTLRFLTIFFSYGGGLVVIGYTLYSIIIKLF